MKHCLLVIPLLLWCAHVAFSQTPTQSDIEAFAAQTGALPTIDPGTNSLSFLRFPSARPFKVTGGDAQQKSTAFVNQNARLFGIRAEQDAYRFRAQNTDHYGMENITMQQTYKGVPVFAGTMKFHYTKNKDLSAMNGNYISDIQVNVVPSLAQHEAETLALQYVEAAKLSGFAAPLKVKASTIYIFQKGLAQGINGAKLLVYEVEVGNDADVREFLYIDAHSGALIEQFTGTHQALHRTLYETSQTPVNLIWDEGNAFPGTLDVWQQSEVAVSGFIYNLIKNAFGHVSYNGADATMITINNNPAVNCPNASWNGSTANYCTGMATDDVVAHEWAHAYTQYTSQLIYQWQPGALNEAYSDIWGETVDQLDGYMDDGESNAPRTGCNSSNRWQMGEKLTAFPGANRDMWDPTCFGDPGKVSDPQYWCSTSDNGGVHHNSGVINHAYALLVDGGNYNNQIINGIGLTKAAHIFWLAQSEYMIATTDFAAQADILEAAATSLIGINLPTLSTADVAPTSSGQIITAADVLELSKVIAAVELRAENSCQFATILAPAPPLCEGANAGLALFYESFQSGLGGFTTSFETSSGSWAAREWTTVAAPAGRAGNVAFGVDYQGGDCAGSIQSGIIRMESPVINIPAGTAGNLNMSFDHFIAIQDMWDGGNIKYSIDGGAWTLLEATAFTANPYNNVLVSALAGSSNPMQSQPAFTGTDNGSVTGSWGQSQVDLTSIGLTAGHNIKFRFELGTNGCSGVDGWYIDDFRVYTCAVTPAVHFALENAVINEGEGTTPAGCLDYVDKIVTIQIDKAPTQPVTVTFNTPGGTAKNGATKDYTLFPTSVSLSSGSLSQNVTLRIYNDAYVEGPETIDLSYNINANSGDGYAASSFQNYQLTIIDDDLTPGNYTEELLNSDFDNGGQQGWKVINGGNSYHGWAVTQFTDAGLDAVKSPFFFVNSNITNGNFFFFDDIIESPPVNTAGKKNVKLIFSQAWQPVLGSYAEQGFVDVWNGSEWFNLLTLDQNTGYLGNLLTSTPDIQQLSIPDAYTNVNMKVRFRYKSNSERWWGVDLIKITASNSTQIASTVNTADADQQYLGPNETAVFYDPATGNLMAKIKNLSAHDYGCTTVEVDRAGANSTPWMGSYQITNKTFKVTPTNNNPAGQYEITIYYKAAELNTFTPEMIKSMGKSAGSIPTGNMATTSLVAVDVSPAFNGDYAFTSTFITGFSGFGLSNAPPGSALPVSLVKFDGKNTPEGNLLKWTTSAEVNNDYYVVEESLNGRAFTETGRVQGMGTSSVTNEYSFTDLDFNKGITYYRLKQVDLDRKFAYSRTISVDALRAGGVKFYPNPIQSTLNVELPSVTASSVSARVINAAGQQVVSREKILVRNGKLNMSLDRLPSGIYQIIISDDKTTYHLSAVKL